MLLDSSAEGVCEAIQLTLPKIESLACYIPQPGFAGAGRKCRAA